MSKAFFTLPYVNGPRFGVEHAENDTYRATIYDRHGKKSKQSDKRQNYGEAFQHALEWSQQLGVQRQ